MTEVLFDFYIFALGFAAVCTTLFPVLYLFSKWNMYAQGRALMIKASFTAIALDLTFILHIWPLENLDVVLAGASLIFLAMGFASVYLSTVMINTNYYRKSREKAQNDNAANPE